MYKKILQQRALSDMRPIFIVWTVLSYTISLYPAILLMSFNEILLYFLMGTLHILILWQDIRKKILQKIIFILQLILLIVGTILLGFNNSDLLIMVSTPVLLMQSIIYDWYKLIDFLILILVEIFFCWHIAQKSDIFFLLYIIEILMLVALIGFIFWRNYRTSVVEKTNIQNAHDELKIAYSQVANLSAKSERERIARDLHDTLLQNITGLSMQLELIDLHLNQGKIDTAIVNTKKALESSRQLISESRYTLMDMKSDDYLGKSSLANRMRLLSKTFKDTHNLTVEVVHEKDIQLDSEILEQISRVVTEALLNVVKHSTSKFSVIRIFTSKLKLEIKIIDFGKGFRYAHEKNKPLHYGLSIMRERIEHIGGKLSISSEINEGTTVIIYLPMEKL
ncbi:histidine kinase [Leuconostoc falkenbergense]|uniref:sensor histidine kinase n=1 Tax=Leuconostoc falkenbergense TaxID=2766470 RepID=UPI0024AC888E|nr:histidine kinase [Leuconostoc falkenbergense]MDI6666740.1 histidine kinase [Leuconostoc falkenbergense]